MDNPMVTAWQEALNRKRRLEIELAEVNAFLHSVARFSGQSYENLLKMPTEELEVYDDIPTTGMIRISERDLSQFLFRMIQEHGPMDAEAILDALFRYGFDPGGADKRKNLTTRLWRIIKLNIGIYKDDYDGKYKISPQFNHKQLF